MSDNKDKGSATNLFGNIFPDSDDDNEIINDPFNDVITHQFQEKFKVEVQHLRDFMNNPTYITGTNDASTNIVDMYSMANSVLCTKTYCIPENKIAKMFKYIDCCRRTKCTMMIYEKQLEYSGIMLDFDICQIQNVSVITPSMLQSISQILWDFIKKYINMKEPDTPYEGDKFDVYIAVIKKPAVKFNDIKKYYKDGFHILIPGIKITRETKKFLIEKIRSDDIFYKSFKMVQCAKMLDDSPYTHLDFVDKNSAHVPVFLLGSRSKSKSDAYVLEHVFKIETDVSDLDDPRSMGYCTIVDCPIFNANDLLSPVVLSHELSLNWETEHKNDGKTVSIIKKKKYNAKEQYSNEIKSYQSIIKEDDDNCNDLEYGPLSLLRIHDPDITYIQELLNTLHSSRYTDFGDWFKVLCVLAHTNKSYKPLAEVFSMKSIEKFNQADFDHHWQSALINKKNKLHIGSLHYWAKLDNPIKYEEVRQRSIYSLVYKKVYDIQLDGHLQHYDIAKILHVSLRHKYVFDSSGTGEWYEFILKENPHKPGEIYKWRPYNKAPSSIKIYTSEILPRLFDRVFNKIDATIETLKGDDSARYHSLIKANLKLCCRKLRDNSFKNGVSKECEQVFEQINFKDELDKDPEILGVGNGILKLGAEVQLITGYHSYPISQYTPVDYIEYNPNNPIIKKLLIAIRNLFPDDEPDTFEFIMHYFASALDGKKKESLLLLLVGNGSNGKSFLVELFKETIGATYAVKMPLSFLTSRSKNSESATPALMMLVNARFAYYSETEQSEVLNLAKVKELTGQETLGGRTLYGGYETFKPTCHHLVTSNYDFAVNGNDHGTWRRLKRITMRIKFCKPNVDNYNENNPHERIADASMGAKWPDDPEVKSAFLSILCYYYESLQKNHGGMVENVPHPNIKMETEAFRDRQDKINNFINIRFVKTVDPTYQITMDTIIEKYSRWYERLYPDDKEYKKSISLQFENSKLTKIIIKTRTEIYIKGYRILDAGEEPEADEIFFIDVFTPENKKIAVTNVVENAEEFYSRLCKEYTFNQAERLVKQKKDAVDMHIKKMEIIKNTPKIASVKPQEPIKITNETNTNIYDMSGFKKNNITELSAIDLKDIIVTDTESEIDSASDSE